MTLAFKIELRVACNSSLCISPVRMLPPSVTIFCLRILMVRSPLLYAGLGGELGVIAGLEFIAPPLPPPTPCTELFLVSIWLSFAGPLYWINRDRQREVFNAVYRFGTRQTRILSSAARSAAL